MSIDAAVAGPRPYRPPSNHCPIPLTCSWQLVGVAAFILWTRGLVDRDRLSNHERYHRTVIRWIRVDIVSSSRHGHRAWLASLLAVIAAGALSAGCGGPSQADHAQLTETYRNEAACEYVLSHGPGWPMVTPRGTRPRSSITWLQMHLVRPFNTSFRQCRLLLRRTTFPKSHRQVATW